MIIGTVGFGGKLNRKVKRLKTLSLWQRCIIFIKGVI